MWARRLSGEPEALLKECGVSKKPIVLGEFRFESRKEAKDHFSSILNSVPLGTVLEGEKFAYAMALLLNHPNVLKKVGCGVEAIKVDRGKYERNRCFHVIRADGSIEDFSIAKCVDGEHSDFHRFCTAARSAVEGEIREFKQNYFLKNQDKSGRVRCQMSGGAIDFSEAHVDHREPFTFSAIAHFFIQAHKMDLSTIGYLSENLYGHKFSDDALAASFCEWHRENAKLRVIAKRNNLRRGFLGRVAATKSDGVLGKEK